MVFSRGEYNDFETAYKKSISVTDFSEYFFVIVLQILTTLKRTIRWQLQFLNKLFQRQRATWKLNQSILIKQIVPCRSISGKKLIYLVKLTPMLWRMIFWSSIFIIYNLHRNFKNMKKWKMKKWKKNEEVKEILRLK